MKKSLFHLVGQLLLVVSLASVTYAEFGLLLASFRNRDNAESYATNIAKSLVEYPCNAFVEEIEVPGTGFWYRVCIGPFVSRHEALAKKEALGSKSIGKVMIVVKTRADATAIAQAMDALEPTSNPISSSEATKPKPMSDDNGTFDATKRTKDITLTWDAQKDPTPAGYKIYYDTKSGPPYNPNPVDYADEGPSPIVVNGDITEITLHGLTRDKNYFFAISAFDSPEGPESSLSREVSGPPEKRLSAIRPVVAKPQKKEKDRQSTEGKKALSVDPSLSTAALERSDTHAEEAPRSAVQGDLSLDTENSGLLSAGDTLEIDVPGQKEMSIRYDVAPDGNIYMMSIGRVSVQGLSLANLERGLTPSLSKFVDKGEKISIKLVKSERYIQITGGVRYPGWYRVPAVVLVKKLIQMAGGLLEGVTDAGIKLRRETREGYREIRVGEGKVVLHPERYLDRTLP